MAIDTRTGTVRPILTEGHPDLARRCDRVSAFDDRLHTETADLAATLHDFRERTGFGRAISGPQIGITRQIIVMDLGAGPLALINPEIIWRSEQKQDVWDDCLSVPHTLVRVERSASISIRYSNHLGSVMEWSQLTPDLAELVQHEIDHLEGVLMTAYIRGPDDVAPCSRRGELVEQARPAPRLVPAGIMAALPRVAPVFTHTPLFESEPLSAALGCRVSLKIETLNPIRCFKGRGASVYVEKHALERAGEPMVAASAGNWGQALAYSCRSSAIPLIVYAAVNANPFKVQRMRDLGAEVRLEGEDFDAAKNAAREHAAENGWAFAEDGRDLAVTEGHGSLGVEIHDTLTRRRDHADMILVPLGNGALVNGVGCWSKAACPATRIIAVSAAGAPAMHDAWRAPDEPVRDTAVNTIADGLAVRLPVPEAVDDMRGTVDDVVLVDDERMMEAARLLQTHVGLIVEPSGAAGLAALLATPHPYSGRHVVVVVTGSNVGRASSEQGRP